MRESRHEGNGVHDCRASGTPRPTGSAAAGTAATTKPTTNAIAAPVETGSASSACDAQSHTAGEQGLESNCGALQQAIIDTDDEDSQCVVSTHANSQAHNLTPELSVPKGTHPNSTSLSAAAMGKWWKGEDKNEEDKKAK